MSVAYFQIAEGPNAGTRFELPAREPEIVVGRSPECHIVLAGASVSRRHARVQRDGDRLLLEDLGSANGTTVNGKPVTAPVALADRDSVSFGSIQTTFVSPPPQTVQIPSPAKPEATAATERPPPRPATTTAVTAHAERSTPSPGLLELAAIAAASFLAVVAIGWVLFF